MELPPDLSALGRIIIAIKTYRRQIADYADPAFNPALDRYLAQELERADWVLWQTLRADQQAVSIPNRPAPNAYA